MPAHAGVKQNERESKRKGNARGACAGRPQGSRFLAPHPRNIYQHIHGDVREAARESRASSSTSSMKKQNLAHRKQVLIIQLSLAGVLGINRNSPRWIKTEMGKLTFSTYIPHHLFPTPVGFSYTA